MLAYQKIDEARFFSERRSFRRMDVSCHMIYSVLGAKRSKNGQTTNLSGSGLQFQSADQLREGTRLQIEVQPESSVVMPLRAVVEVLRCVPSDDGYEIGCRILDVTS
jgi:hypothetical protein